MNHLLGQIGLTEPEQTRWWNQVAHDELGGRAATQAWLAGDIDGVTALVDRRYEASERVAREVGSDSRRLDLLRAQLASLEERVQTVVSLRRPCIDQTMNTAAEVSKLARRDR